MTQLVYRHPERVVELFERLAAHNFDDFDTNPETMVVDSPEWTPYIREWFNRGRNVWTIGLKYMKNFLKDSPVKYPIPAIASGNSHYLCCVMCRYVLGIHDSYGVYNVHMPGMSIGLCATITDTFFDDPSYSDSTKAKVAKCLYEYACENKTVYPEDDAATASRGLAIGAIRPAPSKNCKCFE